MFDRLLRRTALLLAASLSSLLLVGTPAGASTPALMWQDVKRIVVLCNVAGGPGIDHLALASTLCSRIRPLAAQGSPFPVQTIALGDPAVLAPGTVALLVHASVTRSGGDRLLAFSIRPFRASAEQTAVLFGAAPRAAPMPGSATNSRALDAVLAAALAETLPWQHRPQAPQPLSGRP